MGIKGLFKFLELNTKNAITDIHYSDLEDKIVAFDISIYIYQFVSSIKSSVEDLTTSSGKITTHIHGILTKIVSFIKKKIKPIIIFDGKPPSLKNNVLNIRKNKKDTAKNNLNLINIEIDNASELDKILLNEKKIKLLKHGVTVSHKQMEECKELIKLLGIPIIESIEEADSQCAWLVKNNIAHCAASEDMDLLTFGTTRLLKKLTAKNTAIEINLDKILLDLKLNQDEFIDLCILLGCDYCDTIIGIGPKKAYTMILKYRSIDEMIKKDKNFKNKKYILPELFNYHAARNYFKNPPIITFNADDIVWKSPDYNKLKILLIDKYEYSEHNVTKLFNTLSSSYYSVICGDINKDKYKITKSGLENISSYLNIIKNNINFDTDSD
jgi:flap endonuclease-1